MNKLIQLSYLVFSLAGAAVLGFTSLNQTEQAAMCRDALIQAAKMVDASDAVQMAINNLYTTGDARYRMQAKAYEDAQAQHRNQLAELSGACYGIEIAPMSDTPVVTPFSPQRPRQPRRMKPQPKIAI